MSEHTKGRIEFTHFRDTLCDLRTVEKNEFGYGQCVGSFIVTEDARRLAACWNKCEGIETADLEIGLSLVDICAKSNGYQVRLADAQKELAAARALQLETKKEMLIARAIIRGLIDDPMCGVNMYKQAHAQSYLDACDTLGSGNG